VGRRQVRSNSRQPTFQNAKCGARGIVVAIPEHVPQRLDNYTLT